MNRKTWTAITVAGLVLTAVAVRYARTDDGGKGEAGKVIHLQERHHDVAFDDTGDPGPSVGDRVTFSNDLYDEKGVLVGRDGAECVFVRANPNAPPSEQLVQCVVTVQLPGGQITFQGLAQGTTSTYAVTGGTGIYSTARGEAMVKDVVPMQLADITIALSK